MVRDVDNHGHKIWTPFGSSAADGVVLGARNNNNNNSNNNNNNVFNDAQKIEFVLHKNIINSVRVCLRSSSSGSSSSLSLSLSLSLCLRLTDDMRACVLFLSLLLFCKNRNTF